MIIAGFYNRKGFILSQHPLESTTSAMWQLVAEQEVQVVVVLTNLDAQDYRPFWPNSSASAMMWDGPAGQYTVSKHTKIGGFQSSSETYVELMRLLRRMFLFRCRW